MSASLIATGSVRLALRESTVLLMAGLFAALVLVSAWLGWQATDTRNQHHQVMQRGAARSWLFVLHARHTATMSIPAAMSQRLIWLSM